METENDLLQEQTNELWATLHRTFPDADIRFQREEGSSMVHILFRDFETLDECDYSFAVDLIEAQNVCAEAIFSIKEILQRFDA